MTAAAGKGARARTHAHSTISAQVAAQGAARAASLRAALRLSWAVAALAAVAALGGLLLPGLYAAETEWAAPQMRGQDAVTLIAALLLGALLPAVGRGSGGASLAWIGLLGYMWYTYTAAAFTYRLNTFFLVYVALFSLSTFALVAAGAGIDARAIQAKFDAGTPRRAVAIFLLLLGVLLSVLWLGQLAPFYLNGTLPELVVKAETPTNFVYVLDLGLVVPLALLGAWWLRQGRAWGPVLAGVVTFKAATMGLALLGMTWFAWQAGQLDDFTLAAIWVALTLSGAGMSAWFLRHCRG